MTKVKGIEKKQIIVESIMAAFTVVIAVMFFDLYITEAGKSSFYKSDNETVYFVISLVALMVGLLEFVLMFKKMGNCIEIGMEKMTIKCFQVTLSASTTKFAEVDYKDVKSVYMEKKGIMNRLVINTITEQYTIDIKDVETLISIIKQKAGLK